VPKEVKKFINPLLRPSQPLEIQQDPSAVDVVEKRSPRANNDSNVKNIQVPESGVSVADVITSSPRESGGMSITPMLPDEADIQIEGSAVPSLAAAPSLPLRHEEGIIPDDGSLSAIQPLAGSVPAPTKNKSTISGSRSASFPAPATTPQAVAPVEMSEAAVYMPLPTMPVPPYQAQQPSYTLSEQTNVPRSVPDSDPWGEDVSPAPVTLARRKRGTQPFESTHERTTLWIDRALKQAFDELAYEQALPKATLLNEAIADLLRKYDIR
jgi:hypothetical protein